MRIKTILYLMMSSFIISASAQSVNPSSWQHFQDSITICVHPSYDNVNGIHRWLFGENFRKEWAMPVKLPVLYLSRISGGLTILREGGGMESRSLRLKDGSGREWVLRSVEKVPTKLLPENLRGTFAVDWVDDEFSGQHPYSALIVPPIAQAAAVPHANPVIGVVGNDPALAEYKSAFEGMVCLLEEREPNGKSDNTLKMERALVSSGNNRLDGEEFLRARLVDLLIGDWDRHEDQWRWKPSRNGKSKKYQAVPRDRDQVFHVRQGLFPSIAGLPWIDPLLDNFSGNIPAVKYSLYKTKFLNAFPDAQFLYGDWMKVTREFVAAETDSVLNIALSRLPKETYTLRYKELFAKLRSRRDQITAAMDEYYRFANRIVDIRTTDRNEFIRITDAPDSGLQINITIRAKNEGAADTLLSMVYSPAITKEIRLYVSGGNDRIFIDQGNARIKLRLIDSAGNKQYDIRRSAQKVLVYGPKDSISLTGNPNYISLHLSNDTLATHFVPTNLYNIWMPLVTGAINRDDGFLLGLGFRYTGKDAFRKGPVSTVQEVMLTHSFATKAFQINYEGQWMGAIGKADITLKALADAPDNTMNFFGQGNETVLNKSGDYHQYYRARFDLYQLDPAMRWPIGKGSSISVGPSIQYYHSGPGNNVGRSVSQPTLFNSYDSTTFNKDRAHAGIIANFIADRKDDHVLPVKGYFAVVNIQAYGGLNADSRSFLQIRPEFTYYKKLDTGARLVLSDRIGGGISVGSPAFYQSMFLGGQGNLLGYLQNRFAGQQMLFNNLQARLRLANIAGYILPGQLGISGFYDVGRVWAKGESSGIWHQGTGGGVYFAPASLTVVQILAGHSTEGWYPYISLNFRI